MTNAQNVQPPLPFGPEVPLHPDLQRCVVTREKITLVHHPLLVQAFYHPIMNSWLNTGYEQKCAALAEARKAGEWHTVVFLHERPYRLEALVDTLMANNVDPTTMGELVRTVWMDTEYPSKNLRSWKLLLGMAAEKLMKEEEKAALAAMPETLTVYRGTDRKNDRGISWTLNEKTARWFAVRFGKEGYVRTNTVPRKAVTAYLTGRGEAEVIILGEIHEDCTEDQEGRGRVRQAPGT